MKIRVTLTITLRKPEAWPANYGTGDDRESIRRDVREYALNAVRQSAGIIDTEGEVTLS